MDNSDTLRVAPALIYTDGTSPKTHPSHSHHALIWVVQWLLNAKNVSKYNAIMADDVASAT